MVLNILCSLLTAAQEPPPAQETTLAAASSSDETLAAPDGVSAVVLAANADRKGGWVKNTGTLAVWVSLSGTASIALPTRLDPGATLELASGAYRYTGAVSAITAGDTGSLEVVEL